MKRGPGGSREDSRRSRTTAPGLGIKGDQGGPAARRRVMPFRSKLPGDMARVNLAQVNLAQVNLAQVNLAQVNLAQVNLAQVNATEVNPAQLTPAEAYAALCQTPVPRTAEIAD